MDSFNPVVFTTALFVAVFFMDLFKRNYKILPVHALTGFFCILVISTLVQLRFYGTAWLLIALPFIFIIGSIVIRDYRVYLSKLTTIQPVRTQTRFDPAPYFL